MFAGGGSHTAFYPECLFTWGLEGRLENQGLVKLCVVSCLPSKDTEQIGCYPDSRIFRD